MDLDGAVPLVVAGLAYIPVTGVPTMVLGGNGLAALPAMLQTSASGLKVANSDNGISAGATAALTASWLTAAEKATVS
ncbi:MAG: hypothetical protein ACLQUY_25715 [Ktedonobacterales bacterium]